MIYGVQNASISKRLFAFILDFILLTMLATGVAYAFSIIVDVDSHQAKLQEYYKYYEETYDVSFDLTQEDFDKMTPEERAHYDEVEQILAKDENVIREYNLVINLTLVTLFVGVLVGTLIVEFVIPLFLKDGQTIGKRVFSLVVVRNNSVRVSNIQLFVRAVFGIFIVELMIPIYLLVMAMYGIIGIAGPIVIVGIWLLQLILLFATKNHTPIHDVLAYTVVADKSSQLIFESDDALLKYKEKVHLESVSAKKY